MAQKDFLTYVPWEGTKCATGWHKMCHGKAQNVPQQGTKRLKWLKDRKQQEQEQEQEQQSNH
jgi:hypothetical protein